jgi:putative PIN family toxin of toxin-antitoxin system
VLGRTVLDTDVLVAALRSARGASRLLVTGVLEHRYVALASVPLILQYESVLNREEHLDAARVSRNDVEMFLDALAIVMEPIRIAYLWRPLLADPRDDLVLETAVNGRADALVTFNRRHFADAAKLFGLEILAPGQALGRMESKT